MVYCIDTSSLVEAWRRSYPPDVLPSLWVKIEEMIDNNLLISSEEVLTELSIGGDDLHKWAKKQNKLFYPINVDIQNEVSKIMAHPIHSKVVDLRNPSAVDADPFVIATAKIKGCDLVTQEKFQPDLNAKKIGIPNVCRDLGIKHMTFLEFWRLQNWKF